MKRKYLYLVVVLVVIVFSCSDNSSSSPSGSSSVTPIYAYVTDGVDFKIINIATPSSPTLVSSLAVNTSYYLSVSPDIAYVAQFDAASPYISLIDISDPLTPSISTEIPKDNAMGFSLLSDMFTIQGVGYLTDQNNGMHILDLNNSNFSSQVNQGVDAMSITKLQNILYVIDQSNGLYSLDATASGSPISTGNSNTIDVDIASYADIPFGSYHSWVETDGAFIYVANIFDKKIKKFDASTLVLLDEIDIDGYPTAFAIADGKAFVTTKSSANSPLQTSYDGVRMVDLISMVMLDVKSLNKASGVAVNNDYVYVTDNNGLHIYNISSGNFALEASLAAGNGNYIALGE